MSDKQIDNLRELFIKYLTEDSETMDARRKEFNQAIFAKEGYAVFNGTDLDMVLEKFDKAIKASQYGLTKSDIIK
jgi:hypothetical protein